MWTASPYFMYFLAFMVLCKSLLIFNDYSASLYDYVKVLDRFVMALYWLLPMSMSSCIITTLHIIPLICQQVLSQEASLPCRNLSLNLLSPVLVIHRHWTTVYRTEQTQNCFQQNPETTSSRFTVLLIVVLICKYILALTQHFLSTSSYVNRLLMIRNVSFPFFDM